MISQSDYGIRKNKQLRSQWPDLTKDQRALELAKSAMGWYDMTQAEQMSKAQELVVKAEEFKGAL